MAVFIDFKKAYDSVRWEVLYSILIEFGIPMKLVQQTKICLNETYSKSGIGKHLSDSFLIQNGWRQVDALPPLLFNFALEYAIRKVQENQVWIYWEITDTINKTTGTLIDASEEASLEVNLEKTKYMSVSHHQTAGQNQNIKITSRSFENVSQFRYLGTTVTNQNLIQEKIKRRLNFGNARYHSVQKLLSSRLLSKNIQIRMYKV
jgi:hypothetical protein